MNIVSRILSALYRNPTPDADSGEPPSSADEIVVRSALARTAYTRERLTDRAHVRLVARLARRQLDAPSDVRWSELCDSLETRQSDAPIVAMVICQALARQPADNGPITQRSVRGGS